jgi:hypothetical protein
MKILRAERGGGKTTALVRLASEQGMYIVCKDRDRADVIDGIACDMDLKIPYPITARELPLRSKYIGKVLLDDLEDVLEALVGKEVVCATTSCEVEGIKIKETDAEFWMKWGHIL